MSAIFSSNYQCADGVKFSSVPPSDSVIKPTSSSCSAVVSLSSPPPAKSTVSISSVSKSAFNQYTKVTSTTVWTSKPSSSIALEVKCPPKTSGSRDADSLLYSPPMQKFLKKEFQSLLNQTDHSVSRAVFLDRWQNMVDKESLSIDAAAADLAFTQLLNFILGTENLTLEHFRCYFPEDPPTLVDKLYSTPQMQDFLDELYQRLNSESMLRCDWHEFFSQWRSVTRLQDHATKVLLGTIFFDLTEMTGEVKDYITAKDLNTYFKMLESLDQEPDTFDECQASPDLLDDHSSLIGNSAVSPVSAASANPSMHEDPKSALPAFSLHPSLRQEAAEDGQSLNKKRKNHIDHIDQPKKSKAEDDGKTNSYNRKGLIVLSSSRFSSSPAAVFLLKSIAPLTTEEEVLAAFAEKINTAPQMINKEGISIPLFVKDKIKPKGLQRSLSVIKIRDSFKTLLEQNAHIPLPHRISLVANTMAKQIHNSLAVYNVRAFE